jgi:hypothetical protein
VFGMIVCIGGIFLTVRLLRDALKSREFEKRLKSIICTPIAFGVVGVGIYVFLLEYNLLTNCVYVEGITIDYCNSGKSGKGVEFEYYVSGKKYSNCNKPGNISAIKVPGGKFKVRVSEFEPSVGRIDFERPLDTISIVGKNGS